MLNLRTLSSLIVILCAAARPACAAPVLRIEILAGSGPAFVADEDGAYTTGTQAMNAHRWADAVAAFDQVVAARGRKADAALYWKAYSLKQLGRKELATATCQQLSTQFRSSNWNKDCRVLRLSLQAGQALPSPDWNTLQTSLDQTAQELDRVMPGGWSQDEDPPVAAKADPNADLKVLALNSLMHRDPAQAVPMLRNVLSGDQPASLKRHALFVLSQSRSPEAQALLTELIQGKMGPGLQRQAVESSALFRGKFANGPLAEAYKSSSDVQLKKSVISAFFISGDDARLVDLARSEKNMELKRSIVSQLSMMQGKAASDYMLELLK